MMSVTGLDRERGRRHSRRAARWEHVWDALRTERSWVTKLPEGWGRRGKTIGRGGFGVVVGGVVVTLFNVGMAHGRK